LSTERPGRLERPERLAEVAGLLMYSLTAPGGKAIGECSPDVSDIAWWSLAGVLSSGGVGRTRCSGRKLRARMWALRPGK
jgi:hypothetical protein